ncbi:MAG: hypothetical protein HN931_04865 [Desulfobacterales bacterium]|jgi:adenylate cyclase|nr:hypothetical protein [Desulfobacterales bacterium]
MPNEKLKVLVSFAIATTILSIYGGQVCPFLEQLSLINISMIFAGAFTIGFFLREIIFKLFLKKLKITSAMEIYPALWNYLLVDLSVWISIGFLVTFWNMIFYDFPFGSGLKVVLGCGTTGFFSATYFALSYEREAILAVSEKPELIIYGDIKFFSISTKFLIFLGVSYFVMVSIILLLIFKDLFYIGDNILSSFTMVFRAVAIEVLFVFSVIFSGSFFIAKQYGRNLQLMFQLQLKALNEVSSGNYNTYVPVVSSDEFGLIANHSNKMISGLKEKDRIRNIFGKYLSPTIAKSVLENEEGTQLGGRQVDVAILFCDIRNYTSLSERLHPEETVNLLNDFFSMIVKDIHASKGVVDKFIGDAVMAVYGLDNVENPCELALKSAHNIINNLEDFNQGLTLRGIKELNIGIGIHYGEVVAGNIGSKERLEYTVIGDAVNTASRLETLSKSVSSRVLISKDVFDRLSHEMQSKVFSLGEFGLKGKSEKVQVYGVF